MRILGFKAILRQDMEFFDDPWNTSGTLCARLSEDAAAIHGVSIFIIFFWSDGLAIASGGPLNSGPSLSLCLYVFLSYPVFPENRAIEFSNFLHVT